VTGNVDRGGRVIFTHLQQDSARRSAPDLPAAEPERGRHVTTPPFDVSGGDGRTTPAYSTMAPATSVPLHRSSPSKSGRRIESSIILGPSRALEHVDPGDLADPRHESRAGPPRRTHRQIDGHACAAAVDVRPDSPTRACRLIRATTRCPTTRARTSRPSDSEMNSWIRIFIPRLQKVSRTCCIICAARDADPAIPAVTSSWERSSRSPRWSGRLRRSTVVLPPHRPRSRNGVAVVNQSSAAARPPREQIPGPFRTLTRTSCGRSKPAAAQARYPKDGGCAASVRSPRRFEDRRRAFRGF